MRGDYIGDSYDLVKRFWAEGLCSVASLYAHPRFVPTAIQAEYTAVTSVPILASPSPPDGSFGLLLDPNVGVPFPIESNWHVTASHAPLQFVLQVFEQLKPIYVICFDQSYHRKSELSRPQQRDAKRAFLREKGIVSFYYVSHAPFLFMAKRPEDLDAIRGRLVSLGIPEVRLEPQHQ
jgi:hypothetical protein